MAEVEIIKRPDEGDKQSTKKAGQVIKKSAWMAFFESMASIILGILLVVWPNEVIKIVAYALGAFLAVKGGYRIMNYYLAKGQKDFFNNDLFWGTVSVLAPHRGWHLDYLRSLDAPQYHSQTQLS